MTAQKKSNSIELVRPDQITTDPAIQRPLDHGRVTAICLNFKEAALGLPLISRRDDGTQVCLDGQTRIAVLIRKNLGAVPRQMIVHRGLTRPEEAELFRLHNDSKNLSPQAKFRAALIEGDKDVKAADDLLRRVGWTSEIGRANSWRAVVALTGAVRRDLVSSERALLVISRAWTVHSKNSSADIFRGLSNMLFRYGDAVNIEQLAERIAKEGPAPHFTGRYRTNAATRRISAADSVADVAVGIYNYGRPKATCLDTWETGLA
jgi:hypothetical protein